MDFSGMTLTEALNDAEGIDPDLFLTPAVSSLFALKGRR